MPDEFEKFVLGDTSISAVEQASSGRRRFFGRRKIQRPPITHCENCGAQLEGHWCAKCGQPAIDYRRSFRHVIADFLNDWPPPGSSVETDKSVSRRASCALCASAATLSSRKHSVFLCIQLRDQV